MQNRDPLFLSKSNPPLIVGADTLNLQSKSETARLFAKYVTEKSVKSIIQELNDKNITLPDWYSNGCFLTAENYPVSSVNGFPIKLEFIENDKLKPLPASGKFYKKGYIEDLFQEKIKKIIFVPNKQYTADKLFLVHKYTGIALTSEELKQVPIDSDSVYKLNGIRVYRQINVEQRLKKAQKQNNFNNVLTAINYGLNFNVNYASSEIENQISNDNYLINTVQNEIEFPKESEVDREFMQQLTNALASDSKASEVNEVSKVNDFNFTDTILANMNPDLLLAQAQAFSASLNSDNSLPPINHDPRLMASPKRKLSTEPKPFDPKRVPGK